MQLSTRARYAVMAMVELARREAAGGGCCGPVCLSDIAASQHLSLAYLEQLFARLRRAGLVGSARGPGGGYRLARGGCDISIADVVAAVREPIQATRCTAGGPSCMARPGEESAAVRQCQTHDLWLELGRQIAFFLEGASLEDVLAQRVRGRAAAPARASPAPAISAPAANYGD